MKDPALVSRYMFGTRTAEFHVCSGCGVVPVVTSEIAGRLYAVVNVNTFDGVDAALLRRSPANFDGEGTDSRLERRARNWIGRVQFAGAGSMMSLASRLGCAAVREHVAVQLAETVPMEPPRETADMECAGCK